MLSTEDSILMHVVTKDKMPHNYFCYTEDNNIIIARIYYTIEIRMLSILYIYMHTEDT